MFYRQKNSFYRFFNIKYGFTIEGKEKRVNLCTSKKRTWKLLEYNSFLYFIDYQDYKKNNNYFK